ncbi:SAM-dependent methyltransferase [Bradyrhizobium sp. OAE829]
MSVAALDEKNARFWDELCGSEMAKHLGVTDSSQASLKRFDDWFFGHYPYLPLLIPFHEVGGKDVLEIGLGYGTVAQRLAERSGTYTGLDIALGPVAMANDRLRQIGRDQTAQQGSVLSAPFPDDRFDMIVTIGCLHHTGDLAKGIDECYRMLRPGGRLIVMVYNAYSFRRWHDAPRATAGLWLSERFGHRGAFDTRPKDRGIYDANLAGEVAPHLDVVSVTSLRHMCRRFGSFKAIRQNITTDWPFRRRTRNDLLLTCWPRIGGLDIYMTAVK